MQSTEAKIKELKEAMSKFILDTKTDTSAQVSTIRSIMESLLTDEVFTMSEHDYNDYISSDDYYSSSM